MRLYLPSLVLASRQCGGVATWPQRWGRNQEVPGEDPMLTGSYAANFVQGLQGLQSEYPPAKSHGPIDSKDGHMMIVACCKHFLANSLESWNGHTRHNFDARVPLDDLADYCE